MGETRSVAHSPGLGRFSAWRPVWAAAPVDFLGRGDTNRAVGGSALTAQGAPGRREVVRAGAADLHPGFSVARLWRLPGIS